jgi:hypothetical protein
MLLDGDFYKPTIKFFFLCSLEKLRPEKEIERAKAAIIKCKLKIRESFKELGLLAAEGKLDNSLFDDKGEIDCEDVMLCYLQQHFIALRYVKVFLSSWLSLLILSSIRGRTSYHFILMLVMLHFMFDFWKVP